MNVHLFVKILQWLIYSQLFCCFSTLYIFDTNKPVERLSPALLNGWDYVPTGMRFDGEIVSDLSLEQ